MGFYTRNAGVVVPVPPLATASVPAKTIAPVVAVLGVRPVVLPEQDVTPPAATVAQRRLRMPLLRPAPHSRSGSHFRPHQLQDRLCARDGPVLRDTDRQRETQREIVDCCSRAEPLPLW